MKLILIIVFTAVSSAQAATVVEGHLDLRPSWSASKGTFHSEDELGADFPFREAASAGYVQEFRTNIQGDENAFTVGDGYLRTRIDKIGSLLAGQLAFEGRLYLPTNAIERTAGLKMALRPIAKLSWEISSTLGFEICESPILPWYGQAGGEGSDGPAANRAFENRLELGPRITLLADRLSLRVPLIYQALRLREFQTAAAWRHVLWINPELILALAEKTSVGVSYYSGSFVGENASFESGIKTGVMQLVFQQYF